MSLSFGTQIKWPSLRLAITLVNSLITWILFLNWGITATVS